MDADARKSLERLLDLVDREEHHLLAVRQRLFGDNREMDAERVQTLVVDPLGIDRLESFGAKFGRMQDTVVDKLVPALLAAVGEPKAAAIDNLLRLERLGVVSSADGWLQMRGLRNRLVHECFDRPDDLAPALERAFELTDLMHRDYQAIRAYAFEHLDRATS